MGRGRCKILETMSSRPGKGGGCLLLDDEYVLHRLAFFIEMDSQRCCRGPSFDRHFDIRWVLHWTSGCYAAVLNSLSLVGYENTRTYLRCLYVLYLLYSGMRVPE